MLLDTTPTPAEARVAAGPVRIGGSGSAVVSFPAGAAADDQLVYRYDAGLQAWIAVPTGFAGGRAVAQVPAGVPVALLRGRVHQPADAMHSPDVAAILAVESLGIMNGLPDGTFRSDDPVSRYQLAQVLVRVAHLDPAQADPGVLAGLADAAQIPGWARPSVALVVKAGLMRGTGTGFAGELPVTHAQLAVIVDRLLGPGAAATRPFALNRRPTAAGGPLPLPPAAPRPAAALWPRGQRGSTCSRCTPAPCRRPGAASAESGRAGGADRPADG